jgi:hypothetical protein
MLREGRLLARVRHRNVVTVHGAQQVGDEVGVWMELVRGRTLAQVLRDAGPMGADEATVIGVSLCRALAAVHGAGLIHRDVKTQNVMRESGGRIVLMDFGAGRDATDEAVRDYSGTPLYMAPELFRGGDASPASDIYSLGVVLYHLVTGAHPVEGRRFTDLLLAHSEGRRRLLADRRPDLPNGFVRAVERALSADPADRPASAGAFMQALSDALPRSALEALDHAEAAAGSQAAARVADIGAVRAAKRPSAVIRWATGFTAAGVAIGMLGFLMSAAFNLALGRHGGFSDDTPADWWIYGARSLVAPALYAGLAFVVVRGASAGWSVAGSLVPPIRRWNERSRATLKRTLERSGGPTGGSAAERLLLVSAIALGIVTFLFRDVVTAFPIWIDTADRATLDVLRPDNMRTNLYRTVMTLLFLAMVLGWRAMRRRFPPSSIDLGTKIGAVACVAITLLLLELPWRLLYLNEFPRVNVEGARCYQTGQDGPVLLLFCPDKPPPRNTRLPATDPRLVRTGDVESIFTAPR